MSAKKPRASPGKGVSSIKGEMAAAIPDAKFLSEKYDVVVEGVNDSPQKDQKSEQERLAEIIQTQEFARRTEKLVAALDEKNRELEKLAVVVESISPLPGMDPEKYLMLAAGGEEAPDFRDGKIVALAKKTRKLTEALRKEKTLATKLVRENEMLEKRCAATEHDLDAAMQQLQSAGERHRPLSEDEQTDITDELRKTKKVSLAANKAVDELRRKLHTAEQRVKTVERTLAKELGDGAKLEETLSVDSGWRGRAQQIVMLRNKIRRLESGASQSQAFGDSMSTMGMGPMSTMGGNSTVVTNYSSARSKASDVDTKAERLLNDMSETRADAMESIISERDRLIKNVETYKKRIVARDARIAAMESDVTSKRENLKAMVSKADSDSQLITALKNEIARLRSALQTKAQEVRQQASPPRVQHAKNSTGTGDNAEIVRLRRLVQQQAEQIDTQDDLIRRLRGPHK